MSLRPCVLSAEQADRVTGKYVWTLVQGLFFFYLQLLVMPALQIFGVIPNVLLPWMIYTVWKKPYTLAVICVFIIILLYDAMYPLVFGLNSLIFMLLAVGIDLFRIPFEEKSVVARVLTLVLANIIFALFLYLAMGIQSGFSGSLAGVSLFGFLYNTFTSFAVFWLMIFLARLRFVIVHE